MHAMHRLPRILVIPPSYFATGRTIGGGERYALEYAKALSRFVPTTLGLFDHEPACEKLGELTVRVFEVEHRFQGLIYPLGLRTLRQLGEYDLFHVMVFPTPLTDMIVLLARMLGKRIVLTDVGGGGRCWSTYLQKLHRRANLNRLAHGLALLSRHAARFFEEWRQPKTILYGGVDADSFTAEQSRPLGYALYVGRLLPHKGVLQVIQALSPTTPLHVVGRPYDADYFQQLQQAAAGKNVRFIVDADEAELRRQYQGASVVLQPSLPSGDLATDKSELLGMVALEAMASGKPVIVTNTTSLPELVVDGVTGLIVPPYQPDALRIAVEQFLSNPALSQAWGMAARRHVIENFGWQAAARRGLQLYENLGLAC